MSTPGSPPPRPGGSHRAAPVGGAPEAAPASPLLLPVLSVLVVMGAIGLAAWMLLTSGDPEEQANPTPNITQPSVQPSDTASGKPSDTASGKPSDTASSKPTKDGDKNNNQNNQNNQNNRRWR